MIEETVWDSMSSERRVFTLAQKHIVTCRACGNQFDTFRGGYYNSNTRFYTCRRCGRRRGLGAASASGCVKRSSEWC